MDQAWLFGVEIACAVVIAAFFYHRFNIAVRSLEDKIELRIKQFEEDAGVAVSIQEDKSAKGQLAVAVREQYRAEYQQAMSEGTALLMAPGDVKGKIPRVVELVKKYPRVAERVARDLNRQYGISRQFGIPESMLMAQLAQIVMQAGVKEGSPGTPSQNETPAGAPAW